jgi:hypothetical protein
MSQKMAGHKRIKEIINNCKEIDQEELRRTLKLKKTRTAPCAMIKGQSNEAILMGMRMHNSKTGAALMKKAQSLRTTAKATITHPKHQTSLKQDTPNSSDILKRDAPVHILQQVRNKNGPIRFDIP